MIPGRMLFLATGLLVLLPLGSEAGEAPSGKIDYNRDGWGLTHNEKELIASDGSSNLYFLEPGTLRLLRIQGVTESGQPVNNINELEYTISPMPSVAIDT